MDDGSQILLIVIIIFFCAAFYFAIAETSFSAVSKVRIKAAAERGNRSAETALKIIEDFDYAVTTILIGTNITHLGIASIVTVLVIRKWGTGLVSISTIITTIAVFFLSEMLPKSIAKRYPESLALITAGSLLFFMKLFYPVSYVLTAIGRGGSRLLGEVEEVSVTEEELHGIIEDMTDDGMLAEEQGELISSALNFGDRTAESILTDIAEIESVSVYTPPEELVEFLLSHHHSRYPVYKGEPGNIIGTLRLREYLKAYRQSKAPELAALIDPPLFVRHDAGVSQVLSEMNLRKVTVAIVLDKYGKTCGMITVEDALEALVGTVWGGESV